MATFKCQDKFKIQIPRHKSYHLRFVILVYFGFWILSFIFLCGCQSRTLYKESRIMLGTIVEVTSPDESAAEVVFAEIKRVEDLMSKYEPNSEVSRLNKRGKLKISPDTFYLLKKAEEVWLISEGAFDITVAPLLDLWGFTDKKYYLPKDEEIEATLALIGFDKIIFNESNNVIEFKIQGMKIDLGGIAKGYAVDSAVKKLKEKGIKNCLINAGGDIYALGDRGIRPWKVAIKEPRGEAVLDYYLELRDKAVATSGDYEQYFIKGKKRYVHIFNPKTGYPVDSDVASVTVIAPNCLMADALATTIFALGKEKGQRLAERFPEVEVKITQAK